MFGIGFGGNLLNAVTRPSGLGRVFYVDHFNGANTNNGIDPGTPFQTITYALTQCVADRNDYIYVLDCWDAEPAYPVVIGTSRVHIIGLAVPSMNLYPQLQGGTNDVFTLNANYIEIAGLGFVSIGAAGIQSGVATPSYGWIHHCTFATAAASLLNGIELSGGQMGNTLIEDNFFGANITNDGLTGQFVNCIIRNNVFRDCVAVAINLGGVEIGAVYGNLFYQAIGGAPGWAITLATNANGGIIANNFACDTGDDSSAVNPYLDGLLAVGAKLNGWSGNWYGEAVTAPA